jgi:cell wall-associated NlpC family hydrolase
MLARMLQDEKTLKIGSEELAVQLVKDLLEYNKPGASMADFAKYALENYESSGDYWKLMKDGTLVYDHSGWLVDEDGKAILNSDNKQIGADDIETGLLNILFGGTSGRAYTEYTFNQIFSTQNIMIGSGMEFVGGEDTILQRRWDSNQGDIKLNMNLVKISTGNTVADAVFSAMSPGVDRYKESDAFKLGIEFFVRSSSEYANSLDELKKNPQLTDTEYLQGRQQLEVVNREAAISFIESRTLPAERASRDIYQQDYLNAKEDLLQLQLDGSSGSFGSTLAQASLLLAGGRYIYGAENPFYASEAGVDCSGALLFSLQLMGYDLPRGTADDIIKALATKVTGDIRPGDINVRLNAAGTAEHMQTFVNGTDRVDPSGTERNTAANPASIKLRTTPLPAGYEVYRLDVDKLQKYYNPSRDIMGGKLTVSQFNAAWEKLSKYH